MRFQLTWQKLVLSVCFLTFTSLIACSNATPQNGPHIYAVAPKSLSVGKPFALGIDRGCQGPCQVFVERVPAKVETSQQITPELDQILLAQESISFFKPKIISG